MSKVRKILKYNFDDTNPITELKLPATSVILSCASQGRRIVIYVEVDESCPHVGTFRIKRVGTGDEFVDEPQRFINTVHLEFCGEFWHMYEVLDWTYERKSPENIPVMPT